MTTRSDARDLMLGTIKTALDSEVDMILWDDTTAPPPNGDVSWARATLRHTGGSQSALGRLNGQSRWCNEGLLITQLFTPAGGGLSDADDLAMVLITALRAWRDENIWLRNIRAIEVGPDGAWQQTNVIAEFEYHETE